MEQVVGRLGLLSATRCGLSTELEFIASHFDYFICCRDGFNGLPFRMIGAIVCQTSLRFDSEDPFYDLTSCLAETNGKCLVAWTWVELNSVVSL
jgi:hypothetical protein